MVGLGYGKALGLLERCLSRMHVCYKKLNVIGDIQSSVQFDCDLKTIAYVINQYRRK